MHWDVGRQLFYNNIIILVDVTLKRVDIACVPKESADHVYNTRVSWTYYVNTNFRQRIYIV